MLAGKDLKELATKKKYQGLFDIGVFSVHSAGTISSETTKLFKDKATVHCESADYVFVMKPEQRVEFRNKVFALSSAAGWTVAPEPAYTHHMLFEVQNPEANVQDADGDGSDSSGFEL